MHTRRERELKLDAPSNFSLARLSAQLNGYVAAAPQLHRLHTRYFDTSDFRLSRWGCSLRYRVGEGWTLKLPSAPGGEGLDRTEHVFVGDAGEPPAAALELATAYLRGVRVRPVAELRTLRTSRDVRTDEGDTLAQIVEDDVRVVAGTRITDRFREVEVELADGVASGSLGALAALLRECGAGRPNPVPKDVRALGRDPGSVGIPLPKLRRRASTLDVVRVALAHSVERIIRNDVAIRAQRDSGAVHKTRVSVRRLRSDLRTFEPVLDGPWARALADRLRPLGDALGAARDADVLLGRIEHALRKLPPDSTSASSRILGGFRRTRELAYDSLQAMLRAPRYVELLDDLIAAAEHPHSTKMASKPARRLAPVLLNAVYKRARACVHARSRGTTDAQLHRLRIRAKNVRYAAEAFAPVGGRKVTRLAKAAQRLQIVLGDQHDAVVTARRLAETDSAGRSSFVAGELAQCQRDAAEGGRQAWRAAWRAVRRRRKDLRA